MIRGRRQARRGRYEAFAFQLRLRHSLVVQGLSVPPHELAWGVGGRGDDLPQLASRAVAQAAGARFSSATSSATFLAGSSGLLSTSSGTAPISAYGRTWAQRAPRMRSTRASGSAGT